jgi:hypothetical protein
LDSKEAETKGLKYLQIFLGMLSEEGKLEKEASAVTIFPENSFNFIMWLGL